jgi:hypothetical protein
MLLEISGRYSAFLVSVRLIPRRFLNSYQDARPVYELIMHSAVYSVVVEGTVTVAV